MLHAYAFVCVYVCAYVYKYTDIYIYKERERERERGVHALHAKEPVEAASGTPGAAAWASAAEVVLAPPAGTAPRTITYMYIWTNKLCV